MGLKWGYRDFKAVGAEGKRKRRQEMATKETRTVCKAVLGGGETAPDPALASTQYTPC